MLMQTEPSTSDSEKATAPEQPAPEQGGTAPGPEELDLMLRVTPSIA